jgi:hypothetical protein
LDLSITVFLLMRTTNKGTTPCRGVEGYDFFTGRFIQIDLLDHTDQKKRMRMSMQKMAECGFRRSSCATLRCGNDGWACKACRSTPGDDRRNLNVGEKTA